jgi:hypothetical protein
MSPALARGGTLGSVTPGRGKLGRLVRAIAAAALLGACARAPGPVPDPSSARPSSAAIEPEGRCQVYAEGPLDPDLRGQARAHPPRCCPSPYGFDPELARAQCGFAEYLGESEELACVHRFRAPDGAVHELRITPLLDRTLAEASALHELGELGPDRSSEAPAGHEGIWWSAADGRRWAFVSGATDVRRLTWAEAACAPERMLPVLASMAVAAEAEDPGAAVPLPRLLEPAPAPAAAKVEPRASERRSASSAPAPATASAKVDPPRANQRPSASPASAPMLASTTDPPSLVERRFAPAEHPRRYRLPRDASVLVEDLLAAALADDLDGFTRLLATDARIGLPDRRELGSRSIAAIGPEPALRQLLAAAARLPATTALHCPSVDRRVRAAVARGEATIWCLFVSDDGLDLLAFGLRGRVEDDHADARVTYLGLFPARPLAPLLIPGEPPPPPVVPSPELVCGDPHARVFPDLCVDETGGDELAADDPP